MNKIFIYPGTFSPPTYGHLDVANRAAEIFNKVTILCSVNADKKVPWFSPDECVELWKSYKLPEFVSASSCPHLAKNIEIDTLFNYQKKYYDPSNIVMIRGIRGQKDMEHEKEVMALNRNEFGIKEFFFIFSDSKKINISSSLAKNLARKKTDFKEMKHIVNLEVYLKLKKYVEREAKNGKLFRRDRVRTFNR